MPEALQKVNAGDPWRPNAAAHNAFVDATAWVDSQRRKVGGPGGGGAAWPADTILGKNGLSQDVSRWHIVGLGGPLIDPDAGADALNAFYAGPPAFNLTLPTLGEYTGAIDGRWGVALEPIAVGEIGQVAVGGIVPVIIAVQKEWHFRADIINQDPAKLSSYAGGAASILWKQSGTGYKVAVVRLGMSADSGLFEGVLTEALNAQSSGVAEFELYDGPSATGLFDYVRSPLLQTPAMGIISAGKKIWARWHPQRFTLVLAGRECP